MRQRTNENALYKYFGKCRKIDILTPQSCKSPRYCFFERDTNHTTKRSGNNEEEKNTSDLTRRHTPLQRKIGERSSVREVRVCGTRACARGGDNLVTMALKPVNRNGKMSA